MLEQHRRDERDAMKFETDFLSFFILSFLLPLPLTPSFLSDFFPWNIFFSSFEEIRSLPIVLVSTTSFALCDDDHPPLLIYYYIISHSYLLMWLLIIVKSRRRRLHRVFKNDSRSFCSPLIFKDPVQVAGQLLAQLRHM